MLDPNTFLNVVSIAGLGLLLWLTAKYVPVRALRAQLEAKDSAIATHQQSIDSLETRVQTLEADLIGAQQRANALHEERDDARHLAAEWKARYEEQAKYTAGPAFEALTETLRQHIEAVQQRHELMIATLDRLVSQAAVPPPQ